MIFAEFIGGLTIVAGLYYMGIIISRCTLLSARRLEIEIQEKEFKLKREKYLFLNAQFEQRNRELIGGTSVMSSDEKPKERFQKIISAKAQPKNRW